MIVCICRGASHRDVERAIEAGASTVRDLQRCGIGDQCGSCHNMLRTMLAAAVARDAEAAAAACAAGATPELAAASA